MRLTTRSNPQSQRSRKARPVLLAWAGWIWLSASMHCNNNYLIPGVDAANILVIGSMNADTFLPVARLPLEGENVMLVPGKQPVVDVPGGKGCTQAVAAAKLLDQTKVKKEVSFVGQFGNDEAANMLRRTLQLEGVAISPMCATHHEDLPSGRGYVFLSENGSVSAVVSGGSNVGGWIAWERAWQQSNNSKEQESQPESIDIITAKDIDSLLDGVKCIMLQREIPEYVNLFIAKEAKRRGGILVLQDIGGEERDMSREMMENCDYLIPNESEFKRLCKSFADTGQNDDGNNHHDSKLSDETILEMTRTLQQNGARNVLITRGSQGSILITEQGKVLHQPAFPLEPSDVVDETGAGDCYRAAFAVGLLEGHQLQRCMEFASAAGCCSVQAQGAVPSTPTREKVEEWYHKIRNTDSVLDISRGGVSNKKSKRKTSGDSTVPVSLVAPKVRGGGESFPFLIGSRLNSMKDRPELWKDGHLQTARDYVVRQAKIKGLTCVDFNYPQHFGEGVWSSNEDARSTLEKLGLVAGAVCLRYPEKFARGAMNHPDVELRREAIQLTKEAAQVAIDLGCDEVVVWSPYDGYDYPFQVDYDTKWQELVEAFRECCDAFPTIKFSLEYKPTDENTRFFTVPSTAAALLLVDEIDRPNMGLTLDVGHMLMSGESPGQSIAMVGRKQKLFGIQLNDGYTRLAAEDGMMFGSIHPSMALEIMYQLRKINFKGHFYFDTFPQRTDPIKEAEYNIRRVKAFWAAAVALDEKRLRKASDNHDAIEALEIVDEALRSI